MHFNPFNPHRGSRVATDEITIDMEYWCPQYAKNVDRSIRFELVSGISLRRTVTALTAITLFSLSLSVVLLLFPLVSPARYCRFLVLFSLVT